MRAIAAILAIFAMITLAGCSTGDNPSTTPVAAAGDFGISRQQAYDRFKALNIGLLPLDRHTNEMYSTRLPDAGIVIDIFGTSTSVEAIESTFRLTPEVAAKMDIVVWEMLEIALGDDWGGGYRWVLTSMQEDLSEANVKEQTRMNGVYLTLYFIPSIESVMFTVDTERQ